MILVFFIFIIDIIHAGFDKTFIYLSFLNRCFSFKRIFRWNIRMSYTLSAHSFFFFFYIFWLLSFRSSEKTRFLYDSCILTYVILFCYQSIFIYTKKKHTYTHIILRGMLNAMLHKYKKKLRIARIFNPRSFSSGFYTRKKLIQRFSKDAEKLKATIYMWSMYGIHS